MDFKLIILKLKGVTQIVEVEIVNTCNYSHRLLQKKVCLDIKMSHISSNQDLKVHITILLFINYFQKSFILSNAEVSYFAVSVGRKHNVLCF